MIEKICLIENCTGCFACKSVCPEKAIVIKKNEIGHLIPEINNSCIECNLCIKICPVNIELKYNYPIKTYAAWSKSQIQRETSSSGGVAAELMSKFVQNGGVVYGSVSKRGIIIEHEKATTLNELSKFKGSNYVQSYTNDIFNKIKNDVIENKPVLFVGTPCQVAGLKSFMKREYSNLLLVDFVCHGVPSNDILTKYVKLIVGNKFADSYVKFRGKDGNNFTIYHHDNIVYKKSSKSDLYYISYYRNLFLREACYNCKYSKIDRVSDITLGDFRGLGKIENNNNIQKNGVSLVLINSVKGINTINSLANLNLVERSINEAIKGNLHLSSPAKRYYDNLSIMKFVNIIGLKSTLIIFLWKYYLKYNIIDIVKKIIKL